MKKILLIGLLALSATMNSQTLMSENFNALTVGNVATDITGATAGQGGFSLFSTNSTTTTTTNASANNAQIVAGGNSSLGLQITGPNGDKGGTYVWKSGLAGLWTSRTTGNNIIEIEVDINPGAGTTTSRNRIGVYLFNAAGDRVLAGFVVRAATRELSAVAYSTPSGQTVNNWTYGLGASSTSPVLLPANTFSRIGISYNKTTGDYIIKAPGLPTTGILIAGSAAGTDPDEIDFVGFSGHSTTVANTSEASMVMDNFVSRASATNTLLENNNFVSNTTDFSVYPNPANDVVNVSNSSNAIISTIEMTDLNGRVVKNVTLNATEGQINISDLSTGVYMMNVTSDQGSSIKKVVKN
jgi:hypothetical protein